MRGFREGAELLGPAVRDAAGGRSRLPRWGRTTFHAVLLALGMTLAVLASMTATPLPALAETTGNPPTVAYALWSHVWMSDDDGDAVSVTGGTASDDAPRVGDTLSATVDPSKITYRYQRYERGEGGSLQPVWEELAYDAILERNESPRLWYTWYRGGEVAQEGRDPSYTVATADTGKVLSLEVSDRPYELGDMGFASQKSATDHLYTVSEIAAKNVVDPGAAVSWSAGSGHEATGMWWYLSGTTLHVAESASAPQATAATVAMSHDRAADVPWNSSRTSITAVSIDTNIYPASLRYWFDSMSKLPSLDLSRVQSGKMAAGEGIAIAGGAKLASVKFGSGLAGRTATFDTAFAHAGYTTKGWRKSASGGSPATSITIAAATYVPVIQGTLAVLVGDTLTFFQGTADGNVASGGSVTKAKNLAGTQYTGTLYTDIASWAQGSSASNGYGVPWYARRASIRTVTVSGTVGTASHKVAPVNLYHWFDGCTALTSVSLSALFDTSGVTTMAGLFKDCSALTTLDLSNVSVSSVADFTDMLAGCTGLGAATGTGITFPAAGISASGNNIAIEGMRLHFPAYGADDSHSGKWVPDGAVSPIYDSASAMASVALSGKYVRQPAKSPVTLALDGGGYTAEQVSALNALANVSASGSGSGASVVASVPANTAIGSVFAGAAFGGDLPAPTKAGHVLTGWKITSRGGSDVANGATVTKDSGFDAGVAYTITAQWRVKWYDLVVDPNGGTATAADTNFCVASPTTFAVATLLVDADHPRNGTGVRYDSTNFHSLYVSFVRDGYYFDGLWTDPTAGTQMYDSQAGHPQATAGTYWTSANKLCYDGVDGETITVYAHWTPIRHVTLDLQGGTASNPKDGAATRTELWYRQGVAGGCYGDAACATKLDVAGSPFVAVRKDYAFRGYYGEPDGAGTQYIGEDGVPLAALYNLTSDITLHAKWELGEANWAFWSAADDSLNFVYSAPALAAGDSFEVDGQNKRVDAAYAGEGSGGWLTTAYPNATSVPWNAQRASVSKTVFYATTKPTATAYWFAGLANGTVAELDLTKLDTTAATDLTGMFDGLPALRSVTLGASFRFAGTGSVAAGRRALLPTPAGEGYTGNWVNADVASATASAVAYAPAALADPVGGFDSLSEERRVGTWTWSRGYAYAVVTDVAHPAASAGAVYAADTLVFFRSEGVYANASTHASGNELVDVDGNRYTGTAYTGFETASYASEHDVPWHAAHARIASAVVAPGQKIAPRSLAYWFCGDPNDDSTCYLALESVDLSGVDTAGVMSLRHLFLACRNLATPDVRSWGWDTSQVTDLSCAFAECDNITALDLSGWNVSRVADMSWVFSECYRLSSINMENWATARLVSLCGTFSGCHALETLDVSHFDTSKVVDMRCTFRGCQRLESLDLSGWNTEAVTDMTELFRNSAALASIRLGAGFRVGGCGAGDIAADATKRALLPTPSGADVTGRWLNTGATGTDFSGSSHTPADLRDGFDGMAESARVGTWVWERCHAVTLDSGAATTAGSAVVYVRHGGGAYRSYADGVLSEVMTTTQNAITTPAGGPLFTFNGTGGTVGGEPISTMRPGSAFAGYYLGDTCYVDASGHATAALSGVTVTADTTLSVRWNDTTVSQPTPTRLGYTFGGWAATRDATSGSTGGHASNVDVTRYATWSRDADAARWETAYSEGVVEFKAPAAGLYRLEAWGASGGANDADPTAVSLGGYSVGTVRLAQNQSVWVAVGGKGADSSTSDPHASVYPGGYNGGGDGYYGAKSPAGPAPTAQWGSGGGGATHFATALEGQGQLASYASAGDEVYLVAGGAGGAGYYTDAYAGALGGVGGGAAGGAGVDTWSSVASKYYGSGGTATSGGVMYANGNLMSDAVSKGTFGQGGTKTDANAWVGGGSGGGGGWWGGGASPRGHSGAGGGSGFVSTAEGIGGATYGPGNTGVTSLTTALLEDGATYDGDHVPADSVRAVGHGFARITRLAVVTFDKNAAAATGTMERQILVYKVQDTLRTNRYVRTHYDFLGWNTDGAATTASYQNESGITLATDTTLHAIWQAHSYTLTLHTRGGTVGSGWNAVTVASEYRRTHTVEAGDVTIPTPARTGYTLVGWSTDATTTADDFDAGTAEDFAPGVRASEWLATHESDLTLYAVWRAHTFTVCYRDGSTGTNKGSSSHTYDTASTLKTAQALGLTSSGAAGTGTRSGWTFVGWLAGTASGVAASTDTTYADGAGATRLTSADKDTVYLYAVWRRDATFWHGATGAATSDTTEQRWNPSAGTPGTGIFTLTTLGAQDDLGTGDDKWVFDGWRTNGSAAGAHDVEASSPYAGSENAFYAAYARTATFYSGKNAAQHPTAPQYYCTGGSAGAVGTWSVAVPSVTKPDNTWTHAGWREDEAADAPTVKNGGVVVTTGAITADVGPAFNAVWTRTATFYKEYNTPAGTPTQRYNSRGDAYAVTAPASPGTYNGSSSSYNWAFQGWTDVTGEVSASTKAGATVASGTYTGGAQALYALYSRTPQVRYQPNGGSGTVGNTTATQQWYRAGGAAYPASVKTTLPDGATANAFAKAGYTVTAWLEDSASGTERALGQANFTYALTYNANYNAKQLFAQWTANNFTVVYHDGAAEVGRSAHTYDTASALTAATTSTGLALERDGWTFAHWCKATATDASPGLTNSYADHANATTLTATPDDEVHLFAVWKRSVRFYNGDKTDAASSSVVQYWNPLGDAQTAISRPALTALTADSPAWEAVGWVTTTDATVTSAFDAGSAVDHAHAATYYALYRRGVDFYHLGSHLASMQYKNNAGKTQHAYLFSQLPSPAATLDGDWSFAGWNTTRGAADAPAIAADALQHSSSGATAFYGIYERVPQLSYAGNRNTGGEVPATVDLGTQYLATTDSITTTWVSPVSVVAATHGLSRTGYSPTEVDGHVTWNTRADGSGAAYVATVAKDWQPTKDEDKDLTLHAQWTPNQYVATFMGNGNTGGSKPDITSPSGIIVTDVSAGADARATATLTYDVTYTIVNAWTRAGYTFGGWNFGGGSHTTSTNTVSLLYNVANAAEVRAIWNANTITLTLTSDLATTNAGDARVYYVYDTEAYFRTRTGTSLSGQIEAISTPSASGYAFEGYYTAAHGDGTGYVDRNGAFVNNLYHAITADTTLNAKWSYQVSYDANGGTGAVAATTGVYGTNVTLAGGTGLTAPSGYEFKGWATSRANANRGTVAYAGGATRSHTDFPSGNAKLYAVWGRTVTFKWGVGATQGQAGTQYVGRTSDDDGTLAYHLALPARRDAIPAAGGSLTHCGWRSSSAAGSAPLGAPDVAATSEVTHLRLDGATLFAVYSRNVAVNSGVDKAQTANRTQYYTCHGALTADVYHLVLPAPSLAGMDAAGIDWEPYGWNATTVADVATIAFEGMDEQVVNVPVNSAKLNAVYRRTAEVAYDRDASATGAVATGGSMANTTVDYQHYNSEGNQASTVAMTLAENGFETATGYHFVRWSIAEAFVAHGPVEASGSYGYHQGVGDGRVVTATATYAPNTASVAFGDGGDASWPSELSGLAVRAVGSGDALPVDARGRRTLTYDVTYTLTGAVMRPYFTFEGWRSDDATAEEGGWTYRWDGNAAGGAFEATIRNVSTAHEQDVDLGATWSRNTYDVTYLPGTYGVLAGVESVADATLDAGDPYTTATAEAAGITPKPGYRLAGWSVGVAGGTGAALAAELGGGTTATVEATGGNDAGSTFTAEFAHGLVGVDADGVTVTLTALWLPRTVTVAFDANGNATLSQSDTTITDPTTREGIVGLPLGNTSASLVVGGGDVLPTVVGAGASASYVTPEDATVLGGRAVRLARVQGGSADATWAYTVHGLEAGASYVVTLLARGTGSWSATLGGVGVLSGRVPAPAGYVPLTATVVAATSGDAPLVLTAPGTDAAELRLATVTVQRGTLAALPAVTRVGYAFDAWHTDAAPDAGTRVDGDGSIVGPVAPAGDALTYYAHWTPNTYELRFDPNSDYPKGPVVDGEELGLNSNTPVTGSMPAQQMTYDQEVAIDACQFERRGYEFVGWNTRPDGRGTKFAQFAVVPYEGAYTYGDRERVVNLTATEPFVTLYAQWRQTNVAGSAYAVLGEDGALTFFRSEQPDVVGTGKTAVDIAGVIRTGDIYAIDESSAGDPYAAVESVPWVSRMRQLRRVEVADYAPGVGGTKQVVSPVSMGHWFDGADGLMQVDLEGLDSSGVTSMDGLFAGTTSLTSDALSFGSGFTTATTTSMARMFAGATSLVALDVSGWDTSAVESMESMFDGCTSLATLAPVTDHVGEGEPLSTVPARSWETGAVISMRRMFAGCAALEELNVSGWDTSAVESMESMFDGCTGLHTLTFVTTTGYVDETIDTAATRWTTPAVTNMAHMMRGCTHLGSLDLRTFDMGAAAELSGMFEGCSRLSLVRLGERFSFRGAVEESWDAAAARPGDSPVRHMALLPDPPADSIYSGDWTYATAGGNGVVSATELRDRYLEPGSLYGTGTYMWAHFLPVAGGEGENVAMLWAVAAAVLGATLVIRRRHGARGKTE